MDARFTALFVAVLSSACAAGNNGGSDVVNRADHANGDIVGGDTSRMDGPAGDAAIDVTTAPDDNLSDSARSDTATADSPSPTCESTERCTDGLDNNCDGRVDEGCPCTPGDTQLCYDGPPDTAGRGTCERGLQQCTGTSEFGTWGACTGAVHPVPEACDGVDNDCDGQVDESLSRGCYAGPAGTAGVGICREGSQTCTTGAWSACSGEVDPGTEVCDNVDNDCDGTVDEGLAQACYSGPSGTQGVGVCHGGTQTCSAGAWGGCSGEMTPGTEVCSNGVDDDCDGMVDEGCVPCIQGSATSAPWQMNRTMGPICFDHTFSVHGEAGEYYAAIVPSETDAGWTAVSSATIDFSETSALCGRSCSCLDGGEFTYFQTFFDISSGYSVTSLMVTMGAVDDGARVSVYNSAYPGGVVDPGSYILLGGTSTATDLARYIVPGRNRIVITHLDDCCTSRSLTGVNIVMNGAPIRVCP